MVRGPVGRPRPVYVEAARFLRSETTRPIKFTLPGPMTMVDTLYDDHYHSREKLAWAFATILNAEARELEAAGVDTVKELRNRNPENLAEKMREINKQKRLVKQVPNATQISSWVDQAKKLKPAVSY